LSVAEPTEGGPVTHDAPVLRRASQDDVAAVTELVRAAYEGYTPLIGRTPIPMLVDYTEAIRDHEVWVLDDGGAIVGLLEVYPRADHLWVENVAIAPDRQGQGLGRRLLAHARSLARDRGLSAIRLLTNERYRKNIEMYVRYGYVETHREHHLGTDLVHFELRVYLRD
jgi:GNAT superfamily N-acetyltransferase